MHFHRNLIKTLLDLGDSAQTNKNAGGIWLGMILIRNKYQHVGWNIKFPILFLLNNFIILFLLHFLPIFLKTNNILYHFISTLYFLVSKLSLFYFTSKPNTTLKGLFARWKSLIFAKSRR